MPGDKPADPKSDSSDKSTAPNPAPSGDSAPKDQPSVAGDKGSTAKPAGDPPAVKCATVTTESASPTAPPRLPLVREPVSGSATAAARPGQSLEDGRGHPSPDSSTGSFNTPCERPRVCMANVNLGGNSGALLVSSCDSPGELAGAVGSDKVHSATGPAGTGEFSSQKARRFSRDIDQGVEGLGAILEVVAARGV